MGVFGVLRLCMELKQPLAHRKAICCSPFTLLYTMLILKVSLLLSALLSFHYCTRDTLVLTEPLRGRR